MHRLRGQRTYLASAMDRVSDGGVVWRREITPRLNNMGVVVMSPCLKPYEGAVENGQERVERTAKKQLGDLRAVKRIMSPIRTMDLHMVTVSDFMIASIDTSVHACGTIEEITLANQQNKPVLCWIRQGITETPDWLLGMLPSEFFFSSLDGLIDYLGWVDIVHQPPERWYTPKFNMLYDPAVLGVL